MVVDCLGRLVLRAESRQSAKVGNIIVLVVGFLLAALILDRLIRVFGVSNPNGGIRQLVVYLGGVAIWVFMMWLTARVMRRLHISTTRFK
jgi:hypothetical protein